MDLEKHEITTVCLYALDDYYEHIQNPKLSSQILITTKYLEDGENLPMECHRIMRKAIFYWWKICDPFYYETLSKIKKMYE